MTSWRHKSEEIFLPGTEIEELQKQILFLEQDLRANEVRRVTLKKFEARTQLIEDQLINTQIELDQVQQEKQTLLSKVALIQSEHNIACDQLRLLRKKIEEYELDQIETIETNEQVNEKQGQIIQELQDKSDTLSSIIDTFVKNIKELPSNCHEEINDLLEDLIEKYGPNSEEGNLYVTVKELLNNLNTKILVTFDQNTINSHPGGMVCAIPNNSTHKQSINNILVEMVKNFEEHFQFLNHQTIEVLSTFGPWLKQDREQILSLWKQYVQDWTDYDQQKSKRINDVSLKLMQLQQSIQNLISVVMQKIKMTVTQKNITISKLIDQAGFEQFRNQNIL